MTPERLETAHKLQERFYARDDAAAEILAGIIEREAGDLLLDNQLLITALSQNDRLKLAIQEDEEFSGSVAIYGAPIDQQDATRLTLTFGAYDMDPFEIHVPASLVKQGASPKETILQMARRYVKKLRRIFG